MKPTDSNPGQTGRRQFLSRICMAAAAGIIYRVDSIGRSDENHFSSATAVQNSMPTIKLGNHVISRLICGSNPLLGYSYLGTHTDRQMKEYFTVERIVDFLGKCEKAGITAHQSSSRSDYFESLWESGSKLKIISLQSEREKITETVNSAKPIAIVHHGGVSDRLFAEGKQQVVHDFVKAVKDQGILAGVSAHNPDVIKKIADAGWNVDFFMACFYNLTRSHGKEDPVLALPYGSYQFLKDDPKIMTSVIRQVKQPCLGFKILGAGRMCSNQEDVEAAFKFAFENIKPTDGVIVGMFPWFFDEISANVKYTGKLG